jgi:hypothetical protein
MYKKCTLLGPEDINMKHENVFWFRLESSCYVLHYFNEVVASQLWVKIMTSWLYSKLSRVVFRNLQQLRKYYEICSKGG